MEQRLGQTRCVVQSFECSLHHLVILALVRRDEALGPGQQVPRRRQLVGRAAVGHVVPGPARSPDGIGSSLHRVEDPQHLAQATQAALVFDGGPPLGAFHPVHELGDEDASARELRYRLFRGAALGGEALSG